jgi:hypothetical protein
MRHTHAESNYFKRTHVQLILMLRLGIFRLEVLQYVRSHCKVNACKSRCQVYMCMHRRATILESRLAWRMANEISFQSRNSYVVQEPWSHIAVTLVIGHSQNAVTIMPLASACQRSDWLLPAPD